MLEAMIMGAFPLQSDTESTAEWITNGINGMLAAPEDPLDIERAIRRALEDDVLMDRAAGINFQTVSEKLDIDVVKPKIIQMYKSIAAQIDKK